MQVASNFVNLAKRNARNVDKILCPCKDCRNLSHHLAETVYEHFIFKGMDLTYTTWFHHGKKLSIDEIPKEVKMSNTYNLYANAYMENEDYVPPTLGKDEDFIQKLEDAEIPLYPSCTRYTKLSSIVDLYKHKAVSKSQ